LKEQNSTHKLRKSLKYCNNKLKSLLDITLAINSNLPISKLLSFYYKILVKELNIPKFVLFWHYKNKWRVIIKSHVDKSEYEKINVEKDLIRFKDIEIVLSHSDLNISFDFIIPIKQHSKTVAFLLIGDISEGLGISPSLKNLQFVQTLTNIIIVAIQNRILVLKAIKEEQMKKEMETAAEIQKMLIPNKEDYPKVSGLSVEGFYLPHFEVGGDFYDIIKISKNEYFFVIADVSGKGVSAALLMANLQANLRSLVYNKNKTNIEELIIELNRIVNKIADGDRFITMFIAKYNALKGRLIYVNAGHPAPLLYNSRTKNIRELTEGCPGIGMLKHIENIKVGKIKIKTKSKLLCFTDGFYEPLLINEKTAKIIKDILKSPISIEDTVASIVKNLNISRENKIFNDDVSILGIEFSPFFSWTNF